MDPIAEQTFFPKKTYSWPKTHEKMSNIMSLLGKYKLKPQWAITPHVLEWLSSKRQDVKNVRKNVEKWKSWTVSGTANWCSQYAKSMEIPQKKKKIKSRTTTWPSYSTSGYLSEKHANTNLKLLHSLPRSGNNISVHQWWIVNEDVVHIHNGILLNHKKGENLSFVTTWMDLGGIMLSEIR